MFNKLFVLGIVSTALMIPAGVAMSQDGSPCFFQRSDGTTMNLDHLCGRPAAMPQPASTPQPSSSSSDGAAPAPATPLDPSVTLVPGQRVRPPIRVYETPSEMWNRVPNLNQPIQEQPPQQ